MSTPLAKTQPGKQIRMLAGNRLVNFLIYLGYALSNPGMLIHLANTPHPLLILLLGLPFFKS
jgi:hypothetical protein